jgi:tyrosine-protein kinase
VELADARRALRARWWLPVVGVVIGLLAAAVVLWRAVPVHASTTTLFVRATEVSDLPQAHAAELFAMQRLQSYVELLDSEQLARGVVEDLGRDETPADVSSRISVTAVPETVVLQVTVTDSTAARAQELAGAVAAEFTEQVDAIERPRGGVDTAVQVATIEPATSEPDPISPDPARDLALGGGLGLLLGVLLALLPARLRRSVRSADDVRACTGARPLAALVADPDPAWGSALPALDPGAPDAATLRRLRAHLLLGHGDAPPRVVVVTGVLEDDGRSALTAELALSLAQGGSRVVLVEADVRAAHLAGTLALPDEAGLTDVLAGTTDLDSALQPWGDGTLRVLAAGSARPDPSAVAVASGTAGVLTALRDRADVVLVHAPPLSPVPDAVDLGAVADGFLLVTRFGDTPRERLAEAARTLADTPAGLLGVVLTRVPRRAARAQRLWVPYRPDRDVPAAATHGAATPGAAATGAVPSAAVPRPAGPAETPRPRTPRPSVTPEVS